MAEHSTQTGARIALPHGDSSGARSDLSARLVQALGSTAFLGALVSIASWNPRLRFPFPGVDPSWQGALHLAAHMDLAWGTDVIHAYGPLGYLDLPIEYFDGQAIAALAYGAVMHVALCFTLVWALRRVLPVPVALLGAFLLALAPIADVIGVLALFWGMTALDSRGPVADRVLVFGGAALAAFELLVKVNVGIAILCLALACVLAIENRRRNVPLFALTFTCALLVFWMIAGQDVSTIPDYFRNSLDVVTGYAQAFSLEYETGFRWQVPAALLAIAALTAVAYLGGPDHPHRYRIAVVILALIVGYSTFKGGFMRHDASHATTAFWTLLLALGLLSTRLELRQLALVVPVIGMLTAAVIAVSPPLFKVDFDPIAHARTFVSTVRDVADPGRRAALRDVGRRYLQGTYRLDRRALALLGGHTVAIDPWGVPIAWAYGLRWDPLPVLQNEAYTPRLDQLNADALSSGDGPERILRINTLRTEPGLSPTNALDGRYPAHDSPAARVAMLCHYKAVLTTELWQVLSRVSNRCGPAHPLGSVSMESGRATAVPRSPRPDEAVVARVHGIQVSGLERLRALLYRPQLRSETFNSDPAEPYRLIPAVAADGLLMWTPPAADFPAPFALGPQARTVSFERDGGQVPLRIDFQAFSVCPEAGGNCVPNARAGPDAPRARHGG